MSLGSALGGESRSMMLYLSSLHLLKSGMKLAKKTTCGQSNTTILLSYLVVKNLPFLRCSAMLYRWSLCSAAALDMSKMTILDLAWTYPCIMSDSRPESSRALCSRMRFLASLDLPLPPIVSLTQKILRSSGVRCSWSSRSRCQGRGMKPSSDGLLAMMDS